MGLVGHLLRRKITRKDKTANKFFCVGYNKTGTTSLEAAFDEFDFCIGDQREAEYLLDDYMRGDFLSLLEYCKSAQVFQDIPFSLPNTYKTLDVFFPDSKFILSVRDNSEQWYQSLTRFHTKLFSSDKKRVPSNQDLHKAPYVYPGWIEKSLHAIAPLNNTDSPYDKKSLIKAYEQHNHAVVEYFKDRPGKLLIVNVAKQDSYKKFCTFIGRKPLRKSFPWKNKT